MIYLDNAATTKLHPEVLEAMTPYLTNEYGNPGSLHEMGMRAKAAVDKARAQVASLVGTTPEHIIFTSGGSEGNNAILDSIIKRGGSIIRSSIEHDSIMNYCDKHFLGWVNSSECKCSPDGRVWPGSVLEAIMSMKAVVHDGSEILVSVMKCNNETGVLNDIMNITNLAHAEGCLMHSDYVQALGTWFINVEQDGVDFATFSSHKIHGPKGVGAIYVRDVEKFNPLIYGGDEQEFGLRGGTENVASIVGFGAACEITQRDLDADMDRISALKRAFYEDLIESLNGQCDVYNNGAGLKSYSKILNLRFSGIHAESLVLALSSRGICVSAGSACRSREQAPSHVLTAMGLAPDHARESVRFSFGKYNTEEDICQAAGIVAEEVINMKMLQVVNNNEQIENDAGFETS